MVTQQIEAAFPGLRGTLWRITSPADPRYNCIAWAAGQTNDHWWPDVLGRSYWPLGYVRGADASLEPNYDKVALFTLNGIPKHASRQVTGGYWTSKLGRHVDIEHLLDALTGSAYGLVAHILKRPTA
jgi:hypothetical protein